LLRFGDVKIPANVPRCESVDLTMTRDSGEAPTLAVCVKRMFAAVAHQVTAVRLQVPELIVRFTRQLAYSYRNLFPYDLMS
jgi:hypothetical protein